MQNDDIVSGRCNFQQGREIRRRWEARDLEEAIDEIIGDAAQSAV